MVITILVSRQNIALAQEGSVQSSPELFDPVVVRTCSGGGSASHHCPHTRAVSLSNLSPAGP